LTTPAPVGIDNRGKKFLCAVMSGYVDPNVFRRRLYERQFALEIAMRYMLLIYSNENTQRTEDQTLKSIEVHTQAIAEATRRGILCGVAPLFPTSSATTLRRQGDGVYLVTDGPFAETKEQLGGYYILDCGNLDEAIEFARQIPPCSGTGCIEIRPIQALPEPMAAAAAGQTRA
jgi:hypothetical protein